MPGDGAPRARWPHVPMGLFLRPDVNVRMSWEAVDGRRGPARDRGTVADADEPLPEIPCPHPGCGDRFHPIEIALHVARTGTGTTLLRCSNSTRWGPLRLPCPGALRLRIERVPSHPPRLWPARGEQGKRAGEA